MDISEVVGWTADGEYLVVRHVERRSYYVGEGDDAVDTEETVTLASAIPRDGSATTTWIVGATADDPRATDIRDGLKDKYDDQAAYLAWAKAHPGEASTMPVCRVSASTCARTGKAPPSPGSASRRSMRCPCASGKRRPFSGWQGEPSTATQVASIDPVSRKKAVAVAPLITRSRMRPPLPTRMISGSSSVLSFAR